MTPGATLRAGNPVAEWLDCFIVMVDVPVSDAEVALIKRGMAAEVVLEGESVTREASVLLTRGRRWGATTLPPAPRDVVSAGRKCCSMQGSAMSLGLESSSMPAIRPSLWPSR